MKRHLFIVATFLAGVVAAATAGTGFAHRTALALATKETTHDGLRGPARRWRGGASYRFAAEAAGSSAPPKPNA